MFRVKIALLSVLISGAVLVAFGIFFLTVVNRVAMDRIDREILALGESQLHVWHPKTHWQDFDRSLRSIYGRERWKDLVVQVTDVDQQFLYRSPHWPHEIKTALFPEFDGTMAAGAGPSDGAPLPPRLDDAIRTDNESIGTLRSGRWPRERRPPHPAGAENGWPPPPSLRPPAHLHIKTPVFRTLETPSGTWRTGIMGSQHITILLGMDLAGFYKDAKRYQTALLFAVPLALVLLAAGGWLIAHRALKPIAVITRTAEKITARGLDQRIPSTGADAELLQLIKVINAMLDRLEKSFGQALRFSADAAHELQTPLTILQAALDDAVQHAASGSDEQKRYSGLLEEVGRLKIIVRKLLILARADADQLLLRLSPVDLEAIIESAAEDAGVIGPHLKIEKRTQSGVIVQADPDLIRLAIQGLTTNAVKYNVDNGLVRFELSAQNGNAVFTLSNTGPLIPDKERQRIFDRFYRMDKSRSQRVPGTGLGLSLAREIVRAHKGELRLESAIDNLNSFTLTMPCQP